MLGGNRRDFEPVCGRCQKDQQKSEQEDCESVNVKEERI